MKYVTQLEEPQKLIGLQFPDIETTFDEKQAIIYALGIGFSQDPLKQSHFKYTYQLSEDFTVFPTFGTSLTKRYAPDIFASDPKFPKINPAMFLHAEQKLVLFQSQIKPNKNYTTKSKIVDIVDKGTMTLILIRSQTYQNCENKLKLCLTNQGIVAVRNLKAKGFKGVNLVKKIQSKPEKNSDFILQAKSYLNQAIVYRLAGDFNPLHIDPKFAAIQKFNKPIIHGLATKGIIAKAIVENLLQNKPQKLKVFHSRFLGHVFPGQSFEIFIWKMNESQYVFDVKVKQRGTLVLSGLFQVRQSPKL